MIVSADILLLVSSVFGCIRQINQLSETNSSANVTKLSSEHVRAEMSFYAMIYGLGAVAVVIAVIIRGILFVIVSQSINQREICRAPLYDSSRSASNSQL